MNIGDLYIERMFLDLWFTLRTFMVKNVLYLSHTSRNLETFWKVLIILHLIIAIFLISYTSKKDVYLSDVWTLLHCRT